MPVGGTAYQRPVEGKTEVEQLHEEIAGLTEIGISARNHYQGQIATLHTMINAVLGWSHDEPWRGNEAAKQGLIDLVRERDDLYTQLNGNS
jgi:uncharacterized membrane protein